MDGGQLSLDMSSASAGRRQPSLQNFDLGRAILNQKQVD